jgi:hypothetical protein
LANDKKGVFGGQIVDVGPLEKRKCSIQDKKCDHCKGREDGPCDAPGSPEDFFVTERPEPQQVNPVENRRPEAEDKNGNDGNESKQSSALSRRLLRQPGPINRIGQLCAPFLPLLRMPCFRKP